MFTDRYPNLKEFKPYFLKQKRLLSLLLFCMITASSMGVLLSYLLSRQLIAITEVSTRGMVLFTAYILVTVSVHHVTWYLWGKLSAVIGNRVARDIRRDMFISSMNTKYQTIKANSTGYYLERLNEDVNEVSYFVQNVAGTLVDVFTNVSFLVIIYIQSWYCGLFFTLGIIGLYSIDLLKVRVELKHTRAKKLISEAMDSRMIEIIRGIKDIKGLGLKNEAVRMSEAISDELARRDTKMQSDVELLSRLRTYGQWLIDSLLVLICAFWLFPARKISVVVLLIVFNYKGLMYDTVGFFSRLKGYFVQGDYKAGRILEVTRSSAFEEFGASALPENAATVEVRNLSFSYDGAPLIKDASFTLFPATATALTGASGSGKSTMLSLLTKLMDVENGMIFINGIDINHIDEKSLTSHISVVNQEPFMFSDTIRNNLRIAKPAATDTEIISACKMANIFDEIMEMPGGFDSVLSENGANLSGGQKQRLSIARAILKDTNIILFDEPTSALDGENRLRFMDTVRRLKLHKTLFVITHDRSVLDAFDRVLEMNDGKILSAE